MRLTRTTLQCGIAASALMQATPTLAQEVQPEPVSSTEGSVIVVTASRRDEELLDVPSSVTALGSETLETLNASRFDDIVGQIPNISFTGNGPGSRQIILRGISTSTNEQSATVATYVDDVVVGSSTSLAVGARSKPDVNIFDLERIEVLRGPQGTLYGANSLGGLLKYVTRDPSTAGFEFSGRVEGMTVAHGGEGFAVNAAANIPLGDTVAMRISGFHRDEPGYIDNIVTGEEDVNGLTNTGGRIELLAELTPDFSVSAVAMIQDFETGAQSNIDVNGATGEPTFGPYIQQRFAPEFLDQSLRIYALTAEYEFGAATLISTTSYSDIDEDSVTDFTQFDADFVNEVACADGLISPPNCVAGALIANEFTVFPANRTFRTEKISQEVQLVSSSGNFIDWRVGGFYTNEDSLFLDDEVGLQTLSSPRSGGVLAFFTRAESEFEQIAGFGELTINFSERFDVTLGGRYTNNKTTLVQQSGSIFDVGISTTNFSAEDNAFTYLVTPRFHINDTTMIYGRMASGFRPGGPNIVNQNAINNGALAEFGSDNLVNYELGFKTGSDDGRFSLELTGFYIDWSDIQVRTSLNGTFFIGNGGKAESKGAELAVSARPVDGLNLSFSAGYTDAKLTEDALAIGGEAGAALPNAPEWTFGALANYEFPVSNSADANIGASWRYVDDRLEDFRRNLGPRLTLEGYSTFDAFAGLTFDNYSLDVFVRNVFDKRGVDSLVTNFFPATATISRPRTIGISLTANY